MAVRVRVRGTGRGEIRVRIRGVPLANGISSPEAQVDVSPVYLRVGLGLGLQVGSGLGLRVGVRAGLRLRL